MSWISLDDLCRVIEHAITLETLTGPVNAVSPRPVTNREFTSMLAGAVRRPALLPVPRVAVHLALGELADTLLLASTRVVPGKLLASGFRFEDPDLAFALAKSVDGVSTLESSQWIAHPPEDVFPFFASANNLDLLTPKWLEFEIRNPGVEMRSGALINYKLRLHGIPLCWQSEIVEWEPPYRFVDVQRRGPYGLWIHEHQFEPRDGGTVVSDRVRYTVPGGTLVRKLFVERDLSRIFSYRRARLEEHFA
jgi:ligand-binding SRPBCC domain-containing protein